VSSLVYEANARMRDPVYGCVGAISYLQQQVSQLQMQLALAKAEILCVQMQHNDGQQLQQQQMDVQGYGNMFMQNGTLNSTASHQLQLLNNGLGSGGSTAMMLHEACLKKESLWA
jgi:mRNA deadenylase 3'-5' endonuclease subunit Ccr4